MDAHEAQRLANEVLDSVMCDGFDGYFFNSSDDPAETIRALELIGASTSAAIVRRACARFPGGMPPAERFARQEALLKLQLPDANVFEHEDEDFFAYPDNIEALATAYVDANA